MPKYKHLFFDLDNTLYDFESNSYLALEAAFQQLELIRHLPSFERYFEVYARINADLWALYRDQLMPKDVLRGKRHADSLAHFGVITGFDPIALDDLYLHIMTTQTELFPGTIEVLSRLREKGYQLHIITNGFKEVQHHKLVNTGLQKFFTDVYISEDIKAPKPSREIFEHAIKSSNARKKESLMIGDSWESDIVGAKRFGIDQVFYRINNETVDYGTYGEPTYTITNLEELLQIL
jgi:YjjG family noncanonical pyrimidine nucleotidase